MRIALGIATLLTTLLLAFGTIWSFIISAPPVMGVACGLMTVGFGFFIYNDYKYFFGKNG